MARVVIKRLNKLSGSAVKHNVYLDNQYIGILKNGGVLPFEAAAGVHTIHFETASGPLVKKENTQTVSTTPQITTQTLKAAV